MEGALLSPQGLQNLRTLSNGSLEWVAMAKALKAMDTSTASSAAAPAAYLMDEDPGAEDVSDAEADEVPTLEELEQMDLEESEAQEVYAAISGEVAKNQRSWAENKQMKAAAKKERRGMGHPPA
eukprot:438562-Amphidinium_carterae.6